MAVSAMMIDVKNWQRLGVLVVAARMAKGWESTIEWSKHAGVNHQTLHSIERGQGGNFTRNTLRKVEVSLDWAPGSIDSILDGGNPEILALAPSPEVTLVPLDQEMLDWVHYSEDMTPAERELVRDLLERIRKLDG